MSKKSNHFSAALKRARGDKSQKEFADFLGVVQQSYSRYENGTVPDGDTLLKIASKLNTSVSAILGELRYGGMERGETWELQGSAVPPQVSMISFKEVDQELLRLRRQLEAVEAAVKRLKSSDIEKPLTAAQGLAQKAGADYDKSKNIPQ